MFLHMRSFCFGWMVCREKKRRDVSFSLFAHHFAASRRLNTPENANQKLILFTIIIPNQFSPSTLLSFPFLVTSFFSFSYQENEIRAHAAQFIIIFQ